MQTRVAAYPLLMSGLLCLFVGLAWWAGQWGMADIHTYPARFVLDSWGDNKQNDRQKIVSPKDETWLVATEALRKASRLAPNNPDISMMQGRMFHRRALTDSPWSNTAKNNWHQTLTAYQHALQLRPAWGYAWILLAQSQVQSGASPSEALLNINRALTLAPWSGDVQTTSIRLGFALWPLLNKQQQQIIHNLTEKAFPLYGDIILQQAVKYNQLKRIQPILEKNPQWQKTLDKLLKGR